MLDIIKHYFSALTLSDEERRRVESAFHHLNSAGFDHWGADPKYVKRAALIFKWLYKYYFRVETNGLESLPEGRLLLIANHGGQVPIDGMIIASAMMLEANPPRLARGMVERWAPSLPWVSTLFSRCGQTVGDHRNCRDLLEHDECVLVFPEGVGGSGKTIFDRYQLQKFGTGFIRLALETKSPIVPIATIGCEETYPSLMNIAPLAKLFKAPYIPLSPTPIPLPTKITIRFGKPMQFDLDPDAPDLEIEKLVKKVKNAIQSEIDEGLEKRGGKIFSRAGK